MHVSIFPLLLMAAFAARAFVQRRSDGARFRLERPLAVALFASIPSAACVVVSYVSFSLIGATNILQYSVGRMGGFHLWALSWPFILLGNIIGGVVMIRSLIATPNPDELKASVLAQAASLVASATSFFYCFVYPPMV